MPAMTRGLRPPPAPPLAVGIRFSRSTTVVWSSAQFWQCRPPAWVCRPTRARSAIDLISTCGATDLARETVVIAQPIRFGVRRAQLGGNSHAKSESLQLLEGRPIYSPLRRLWLWSMLISQFDHYDLNRE